MPFINPTTDLLHSFDQTNFDLEDSSPAGGPINAPNNGHQQIYTPQNKFNLSPEYGGVLETDGFSGNPTAPGTGFLDLENNGPTNVANYNHQQNWTPTDKFIDSPEGSKQGGNLKNDGFSGNPLVPNTGFLDLENNGPTNVANYNHQQNWTPTDKFINSPEGQLQGGNLKNDGFSGITGISGSGFLDLENNDPINVARYTHEQVYSPQDGQGYIDSPQGKLRSPDSAAEKNNFKTSGLDLEDELAGVKQGASGGPNRTNAIQSKKAFQSGDYTVIRAGGLGVGNIAGMNGQGGGVIKQTLHTYTPQNPYFEAGGLDLPRPPIGSPQSVNPTYFTPKNNVVVSDKTTFYNATIK